MEEQEASAIELENGSYMIEVELEGGTGRATITSPTELTVQDGEVSARIEWSSSHYDYMIVGEEKYFPVNKEGNSVFEIPVPAFDASVTVIADTTAMSVPHEVEYVLTFDASSITSVKSASEGKAGMLACAVILAGMMAAAVLWRKNKKGMQSNE